MDISIDIVELPHKGVKLYCEDNGKPLPQRSWSTLACLVDGNLGDYWQDDSEMGTEEVISNSSRIDEIEVDEDDRERNPDVSSRKEGRTIGGPQENASIHSNSSPSDKNQVKNVKVSSKNDDESPIDRNAAEFVRPSLQDIRGPPSLVGSHRGASSGELHPPTMRRRSLE